MEAILVAVIAAGVPFLFRFFGPEWVEEQDRRMQEAASSLGMTEDAQAIMERRKRRIESFAHRSKWRSATTLIMWGYMSSLTVLGFLAVLIFYRYCPYPLEYGTAVASVIFIIFAAYLLRDGRKPKEKPSSTESTSEQKDKMPAEIDNPEGW